MLRRIEIASVVALGADGVALSFKFAAMGVVAVAAYYAGLEHFALLKGAQHKDFFPHPAIGIIQRLLWPGQAILVMDLAALSVRQTGS